MSWLPLVEMQEGAWVLPQPASPLRCKTANQCKSEACGWRQQGTKRVQVPGALEAVAAMVAPLPFVPGPGTSAPARPGSGRLRDPNTCFFEGSKRPARGSLGS